MIIQFWLGAILLLIIASAIFVIPFLSTKKNAANSIDKRNQLNRDLYDVRIKELEQDDEQGLIIDKNKIVSELQHNLLDDINDKKLALTTNEGRLLWLPGLVLLIAGSIAMYWSIGAYQQVNDWEETLQRYPALQDKLFNDLKNSPTEQDLRDIMLGLRTQLASEPNDADGWLLYSRLAMVFKDLELSLDAIKKAYALKPNSADIRLVYIQLKMQKGDDYSQQQAELMLAKLLVERPTDLQAWSMYAFMALEQQDFASAINRWQKMLALTDITAEQVKMITGSISYAKRQLSAQQGEPYEIVAVNEATVEELEAQKTDVDENGAPIYTVNISVSENVVIPDSGFIIVYAQAISGPKIPIAAIKLALTSFPFSTQISDVNAMMQGIKLSDQSEFVIKARLSISGDVMNKSGDWQGVSHVIKTGQVAPINIIIKDQL